MDQYLGCSKIQTKAAKNHEDGVELYQETVENNKSTVESY